MDGFPIRITSYNVCYTKLLRLIGTASSALLLGETLAAAGKPSPFRSAVLGAEQWGEKRRKTIEDLLGADTYDIYGMTETYVV